MRKFLKVVVGLIVGLVVLGAIVGRNENGDGVSASTTSFSSTQTPEQSARRTQLLRQPETESLFVQAVANTRAAYNAGKDDFARGATRPARKQAVCSLTLGRSLSVQDWIGQVSTRSTNGDGKGVLGVTLADSTLLTTWNNGLSDVGDHTLVEPGSVIFQTMGTLQDGDWVRISGHFFRSDTDCVKENSLTIRGSMTSPAFLFKFDFISRIAL